jgi:hypothetical protein
VHVSTRFKSFLILTFKQYPAKKDHSLKIPEAGFLDEIQTKVLRVFLLFIHSHINIYSKLTQPLTVFSVKENGGKPERKPYPLPYGFEIHTVFFLKRRKEENLKENHTPFPMV